MLEFDENGEAVADFDFDDGEVMLGDIVISLQRAAEQAERRDGEQGRPGPDSQSSVAEISTIAKEVDKVNGQFQLGLQNKF